MSTVDMPPNAHSGGGGKKKNKKERSAAAAAAAAAQQQQQQQQQAVAQAAAAAEEAVAAVNAVGAVAGDEEERVGQPVQVISPLPKPETPKKKKLDVVDTEEDEKEKLKTSCDDLVDLNSDTDRISQDSQAEDEAFEQNARKIKELEIKENVEKKKEVVKPLEKVSPTAPPRKSHQQTAKVMPSPVLTSPIAKIPQKQRASSVSYNKGQTVRPSEPPSSTIVGSVAELVQDVIPKSQSHHNHPPVVEKVEWVQMSSVEKNGNPRERLDILVIALIRGYQIWSFNPSGECEEVMSVRQGPIRACEVLPTNIEFGSHGDPFADHRPLMAIVDASSPVPEKQYSSVQIVSLSTGAVIHQIKFDEQVLGLNVSQNYLMVSLSTRVFVYDIVAFSELCHVTTAPPMENSAPAAAICGQMLAYADSRLNVEVQSAGGLAAEVEATNSDTYTDQVFSAVNMISRTMKSFGESVGATVSGTAASKNTIAKGIVTIRNLLAQKNEPNDDVLCHFIAHVDGVSYIDFSPDQRLVLTADTTATVFNVFLLLPHSVTSTFASVQHLYKLNRGSTTAKVTSTAFSIDSRWLAVGTNHGTCHVFAICPFGGKPTQRTHGDLFVNKESRFHRSAGLADGADVTASLGPSRQRAASTSISYVKEHPVAVKNKILARTNGNARVGPFPPALLLNATKKIKDQWYTTENLTARAKDITSLAYTAPANGRKIEKSRFSVSFASKTSNTINPSASNFGFSLLIASADATTGVIVTEYDLRPRRQEGATQNPEDAPKLNVKPTAVWHLQRTKNNADLHAPMPIGSPIINIATKFEQKENRKPGEEMWTPHVETRTYQPPHRWIWQGPQFEFYVYKEDDSAVLMSPHDSRGNSHAPYKSIPVVIGGGISIASNTNVPSDATRIECGSYSSSNSFSFSTNYEPSEISLKIADAMREVPSTSPVDRDPNEIDQIEEFFETNSPSFTRHGSSKSSSMNSKKAPPTCAPPPPPKPQKDDLDDLGDFELEDGDI